jgi:thymidine kinase
MVGKFNLILGCMFSGKTSTLIERYNRYAIGGKKCIMVKYKNDTRYDSEQIVTHDGIKVKALVCEYLFEVDSAIKPYDVVCIDEIQFYKDAHIFCDKWANDGKIVEACGLNGSFDRKPFESISRLIPYAENITYKTAICKDTGNDAVYTARTTDDMDEEIIGGEDLYNGVDRKTYFRDKKRSKRANVEKFREFIDIFCRVNKIILTEELINKFIDYFKEESNELITKGDDISYTQIIKKCLVNIDSTGRFITHLDSYRKIMEE